MQTNFQLKKHNTLKIFRALLSRERISRKEIASITQLSWGSVSAITNELIDKNLVIVEKDSSAGGRPAELLTLNPYRFLRLGIDINSVGLTFVIVNLQGKAIYSHTIPMPSREKDDILACLFTETETLLKSWREVMDISLSMQGKINRKAGISVRANFSVNWTDVPLVSLFESRFHLPTYLYHDPDCLLYYHYHNDGRIQNKQDGFAIRLDNGIGMARLLQGKLYFTAEDGAYEFGQIVAIPNGISTEYGKNGCLEAYASIRGMREIYAKYSHDDFIEQLNKNNERALEVFNHATEILGVSIANLFTLSSPQFILLDGVLLSLAPNCFSKIQSSVENFALEPCNLLCANYKKEAPAVGACLITLENNTENLLFDL